MVQFLGNIEAKIDAKGRVFLPAAFRKALQSGEQSCLVLRKDIFQDCLVLYPLQAWEEEVNLLRQKLNKWNKEHQQLFRQFMLDSERLELDANGRILIPKRYLQLAKIDAEVRFLGVDATIEIWAKSKLDEPLMTSEKFSEGLQRLMNS
ncbi:MAG: cell division/cell wall cluster transcriptional repressor MraZ [Bacteroidales bacterium 45-6]|nr:MAG: cell division/cell wall cluster transcriptional repressor MraZ [Bacteroidales bacterium 45-6]